MFKWFCKLPRIIGTGFSFACLFGGGALIAILVFPVIALMTPDPTMRRERNQYLIHLIFQIYIWMIQFMRLVRIEVQGADILKRCRSTIIIANHPTLLDVVVLMSLVSNAQCVVKSALWSSWTLGRVVRGAGYIRNDLPSEELLEECVNCFRQGANLIIFPEGTRTVPGAMPSMRRGFANIALFSEAEIQLVTIDCTPPTLTKGEKWWQVPAVAPVLRVRVGERINPADHMRNTERAHAARRLVNFVEDYYTRQLAPT